LEDNLEEERLQKFIANQGICSRRKAEEYITSGRIKVNGNTVIELGTKINSAKDIVEIDGKKTKAFAYLGYPEGAKAGDKLPAVVLVHGGGGHAYADWVKYWNDNGYVAIAMDNTGYFPNNGDWVWGLENNPDFNEEGYTSAPNNDNHLTSDLPLEDQWMYHAVAQTILARNILMADETVDAGKVGITGISWGGKIGYCAAVRFKRITSAARLGCRKDCTVLCSGYSVS